MYRLIIAIFLYIFIYVAVPMSAQNRYALLVGISNYDTAKTGWERIHGTNDVALLKKALKGFSIETLLNEQATFRGIEDAINRLESKVTKGDIVYLHFSGHGQPFEDLDGDEPDGWDEAFVPYDAGKRYKKQGYSGDKHLTDDILHKYIERLRLKAGTSGMVYVSIDACHAGDSYRNDDASLDENIKDTVEIGEFDTAQVACWSKFARGSADGFSKVGKLYSASKIRVREAKPIKKDKKRSPTVVVESCLSTQRSYELKLKMKGKDFYCGSLSYIIFKVLMTNSLLLSQNTSWIKNVKREFRSVLPSYNPQKLVIETTESELY